MTAPERVILQHHQLEITLLPYLYSIVIGEKIVVLQQELRIYKWQILSCLIRLAGKYTKHIDRHDLFLEPHLDQYPLEI